MHLLQNSTISPLALSSTKPRAKTNDVKFENMIANLSLSIDTSPIPWMNSEIFVTYLFLSSSLIMLTLQNSQSFLSKNEVTDESDVNYFWKFESRKEAKSYLIPLLSYRSWVLKVNYELSFVHFCSLLVLWLCLGGSSCENFSMIWSYSLFT